ncbi:Lethal(2) giant larvae sro7 [Coemansia sp. RSA 2336]|nr:Lethal(2) giant larvae sro7 [Coemansia sp. RSA 2336]
MCALRIIEDLQADPVANATAAAFDPIQQTLAVGYSNGSIRLFTQHATSTRLHTNSTSAITHIKFITGHAALACIDHAGLLRVFDLETLEFCFDYQVPIAPTCISSFAGTSWVLVGTEGGRVYFVDCVNGCKSDYSIGCLAKPVAPVAAVETHPLETEKILIAYANGTAVVCDLGKASESERAMTVGKYSYELPSELATSKDVWILDAGWSPAGDKIAVSYSNGVIAIFASNGGSKHPMIARTIQCPDIQTPESTQQAATTMASKLSCLGSIRWCTHGETDRSFLIVTSGSTIKLQSYIHILSTNAKNADVKCSQDIVLESSFELPASLLSISTVTSSSPWRNGNDGVVELVALVGQRTFVQRLRILPDLHVTSSSLPGELEWYIVPVAQQFAVEGALSTVLSKALLCSATADTAVPDSSNKAVSQLYCCVDDTNTLSFWCTVGQRLCHCAGVSLNTDFLFRMVGAEGQIASIHFCALSGLLAMGTDSGETFLCLLTTDSRESLAQQYTPTNQLRKLALQYYNMRPQQPQRPPTTQSSRPHSTQVDSPDQQHLGLQRHRSASLHDGGFIKRKSKRLSSSFGMLFRRGSSASGHIRESSKREDDASKAALPRDTDIDTMAWKQQLDKLTLEMTSMVYGLQFDPQQQQQLLSGHTQSTDASSSHSSMDMSKQKDGSLQLFILPFMLARFVCCSVVKVVAGEHGLVAIAYSNGALVVVDAINQKAVLADNINLSPKADSASVSDIFGTPDGTSVVVTTMAFAFVGNDKQMSLLAGTSCGHVYQYSDFTKPPKLVAIAPASPIIYLALEPADDSDKNHLLVVGTVGSVTLYQLYNPEPVATFQQPSDIQFLSMQAVRLKSGRHGIAAIASNNQLAMLSLPGLTTDSSLKLPSDVERLLRASDACIDDNGNIQILGPGGRLVKLHVTDAAAEPAERSMQHRCYDNSLKPPPQPVRKGITSWLLGKATDPTADIDAFLGSHHRDLLARGGTKPGARLHNNALQPEAEEPPSLSKRSRQDSKLGEIDKSLDMGEIAETKELLERRGQELEDVSQAMDQLSLQSEGFLKKIRAYNAEQEKKSKRRFGLF